MATQIWRSPGDTVARANAWFYLVAVFVLFVTVLAPVRGSATPFAAVVMDARSGEILHARNHDTRLHPASLTKMMTLYVVFEAIANDEISLDTMVTVSRRAASEVPSRLGLRTGQRIALRYLIRAAALRSGNDAATAIAEAVSGSVEAFAARMTRTAAAIGMNNTRFLNAHGLTEVGHYSTARDMTLLGRQLYFDYPQYYNLFSRRSEHAGVAHVRNTNSRFLDGYRGADGIKTGFTRAAGYNLTASAERNGVRVIVTVFGGRSVIDRHQRVVELMDMGFARAPARVAVRRPSRPNYAPAQVAQAGSGRAAGRTIRLQTAPQRSLFPQPRPVPGQEPAAQEMLVALQEEIGAVLAEVAAVSAAESASASQDDTPAAEGPETQGAVAAALGIVAPDVSPVPVARPPELAIVMDDPDPDAEAEIASRAVSGPLASLDSLTDVMADADPHVPEPGQDSGVALDPGRLPDAPETAQDDAVAALAAAAPLTSLTVTPPSPQRFDHSAEEIGPITVRDGLVMIPGLPAIAFDQTAMAAAVHDAAADSPPASTPVPTPQPAILHAGQPADSPRTVAMTAPEAAQTAEAERPEMVVLLTASDAEERAAFNIGAQLPEIVSRAATGAAESGWAVRLGDYPSRFDAERALLRMALAESSTLGRGGRRVGQRGGRFLADIDNLTQQQAELACVRLSVRAQPCEVLRP
ncbi:MAG: serine hydrolase [Pararhodobacter sp.]